MRGLHCQWRFENVLKERYENVVINLIVIVTISIRNYILYLFMMLHTTLVIRNAVNRSLPSLV
jgi:hypothetical protein